MAGKKTQIPMDKLADQCELVANTFKILSHPQRLMVLCHLTEGEKSVGQLVELCGNTQSHMSQFLNRMKLEGVVESRREGTSVYYTIASKEITDLLSYMGKNYCK
jgi:DNA-binding transcriptional ArsR family regulator